MKLIYPIDEQGFVVWTSERHRFESDDYQPQEDEVDAPVNGTFIKPRWDGEAWVEGGVIDAAALLEQGRSVKLAEIGAACTEAIHAGIEVAGKRYSLTEHDQIELMAQQAAFQAGAQAVPYHADGELCRMFTSEEFMEVANATTEHIFFHRTYCNHVNAWVRRAGTFEELENIQYTNGMQGLPDDLAANMAEVLGAVSP